MRRIRCEEGTVHVRKNETWAEQIEEATDY
jgi:hypothetical protein